MSDFSRTLDELERRVAERTRELEAANETLRREIQERQRAQQQSQESQKLLRAIIDNSPAVIYVKDLQGRYLLVNQRFLDLFHAASTDDVIGKSDYDFFSKEAADAFRAMDQRVAAANRPLTEEEIAPHDDGPHAYISVKKPLLDETGKPYAVFGVSTDITEHKRAAERTQWLASFPELDPNPIVELDFVTSTIHYQNRFAARLFPALQTLGPEHPYLAGMRVAYEALRLDASHPFQREVTVDRCHYAQTISFVPENGRLRIYGMDITELMHTEEQLKTSLKEVSDLKAALDEHAIVAITDPQGKITYVNEKFCSISKYSRAELLGQDHRIINSGYHPKEFIRNLWTTITHGKVWQGEIKNKAKDGSYYWVDTTIVPFLNEAGKPRQYIAIRADITERKRAEEALRESEERFRALVTASSDVVYRMSPDWAEMRHLRGNNFIADTEAPSYMWLQRYIHPKDQPRVLAAIKEAIQTKSIFALEHQVVRVDGTLGWTFSRAVPLLDAHGEIVEWCGAAEDITERKHAQEEINALNAELEERVARRTAELEAANKELEAFSYSVSHDLRAPLRAINGFAGIVMEDFGPQLPPEAREHLARMRNGALRMGELVDDLLTFARLSRQPLNRQAVDTTQLVQDTLAELNLAGSGRQIETRIGELSACQGDRTLLKQVWINLLSNAVKYTRDRNPAVIEIGCEQNNGECAYFVRDNGVGFDMQYAGKLFGVFQRLHRVEDFEGTGVGLAIVQRIIHRHGGRVWADAAPGRGAAFYFTLEQG